MDIKVDGFIFKFIHDEEDKKERNAFLQFSEGYGCSYCGRQLDYEYCEIILLLKEANLLPEGFKSLCCMCYFFDKIGILYLRDKYDGWDNIGDPEKGEDILLLNFDLFKDKDDASIDDYDSDNYILKLRIHDYKKILFS